LFLQTANLLVTHNSNQITFQYPQLKDQKWLTLH
jgi:hypothetical protein